MIEPYRRYLAVVQFLLAQPKVALLTFTPSESGEIEDDEF